MSVRRIVPNLQAADPTKAREFYGELLGLDLVMDHKWLVTYASGERMAAQISIASEGGSGTPVPGVSIEVDDVEDIYRRAKSAGFEIVYDLTDEPWGVRRFFVRDPFGTIVNILIHKSD